MILNQLASALERDLQELAAGAAHPSVEIELRKLSLAVQKSGTGIMITDPAGAIEFVNPKFEAMTGYSAAELKGQNPRVFKSNKIPLDTYRDLWETIAAGREWRGEIQNRKKTGELYWEKQHISPVFDDSGRILYFIAIKEDVTEQRRAERALRESEGRFRSLTALSSDFFWETDAQHRFQTMDYMERFLGPMPSTAYVGKTRWEVPHVSPDAEGWQRHRAVLDARQPFRGFAFARRAEGGDIRHFKVSGDPLFDDSGAFRGYRGVGSDVTERELAEAKVLRQKQLYAALSACNKAIVHCASTAELFPQICRAAVQFGGMKLAWIGMIDAATLMVPPIASFGAGTEYLGELQVSADAGNPFGRGTAGTAIREDKPYWCQDYLNDPVTAPWRDLALRAGWAGSASLPLHRLGAVVGVLFLYSGEANFFDESTRELMVEMAADISFALDNFAREARRRQAESELHARELRYRAVTNSATDAFVTSDAAGRIVGWNPSAERLFGYAEAEVIGQPLTLLMPERFQDRHLAGMKRVQSGSERRAIGKTVELVGRRKDASEFPMELSLAEWTVEEGQFFTGMIHDITERKHADDRIRRLNRIYAVLSGINSTIVRVKTRDELFKEACRIVVEAGNFLAAWIGIVDPGTNTLRLVAWQGLDDEYVRAMPVMQTEVSDDIGSEKTGLAPSAMMHRKPMIAADMTIDPRAQLQKEAQDRGFRSLAMLPLVVSGEAVGVLALYAAEVGFFDEEEMKLLNELAGDISFAIDHIEKASKLDYLAFYDQLTGLANRALFLEQVNQSIKAAGPGDTKFALAILDIERLRSVNESLGRQAGDALLRLVAERLTAGGGRAGAGRIGADQYALILGTVKGRSEAGRIVTNALHKCFDEPFQMNGVELRLSAKAGVAQFPGDGDEAEALLRNAEAALRRGKETGDPITFHAPEMTAHMAENLTLENKLRQALEKEEFVLHYQPKVDLDTRRIVGVEALLRWQSPERGLVPPGHFVPLLEETGLILQVGAWALQRAVRDHGLWLQQGVAAPRIAVNVSAIQLRQHDFVKVVKAAIARDADPTAIDLEITESLLMDDVAGNIGKLKALRDLGMKLSIDDFGTGYSSLGYLAKLPVHMLKIDRSFITTMLNNADSMTLVSTIISLAHSLRLSVVAEGVEQEEQAKMLRLLRCDQIQGYLISKPVPVEEFAALLRKEKEGAA